MKTFKKCLAFLLALFIIAGNLPLEYLPWDGLSLVGIFDIQVHAEYYTDGIYDCYVDPGTGKAEIISINSYIGGIVVIPSVLGGHPVESIGDNSFKNKIDITSLTVPVGVKSISNWAFEGCKALTNISLPAGLLTIGNYVFKNCSALSGVVVPDSVTSFGDGIFYGCSALSNASVGDGIVGLGTLTFYNCTSLTVVELPANLQSIGSEAFMGCSALQSITLPASLTNIEQYAFRECVKLTSAVLPSGLQILGNGVFYGCKLLAGVNLPATVTSIGEYAFYDCDALISITIPFGITTISNSVFDNCNNLSSVSIPSTVTSIGNAAFAWCFALTAIDLPSGLTSIGNNAFWLSGLTRLALPEGLLTIGINAFKQCSNLKIVSIPSTVTALPDRMFQYCGALVSVTIPASVTNFGADVFTDCPNVIIYCYPGSVVVTYATAKSIPYIFITSVTVNFNANGGTPSMNITRNCGTALTAPAVTRTGYSFSGWLPAVPVVFPNSNTTYTAQWTGILYTVTFRYGSAITTYHLNYGVPMPNQQVAFHPDDLNIFTGWSPVLPATVPAQDITFNAQYTPVYTYTVSNGEATITDCSTLVTGALEIPAVLDGYPVKIIGYNAFKDCTGITSVTIPASVTAIDVRSFDGCTGLTSITIPGSVTSVGSGAFQNCTALAAITVPDTLVSIGTSAFLNTAWFNSKPDGLVYAGKFAYKYKGTMPALTGIAISAGTLGIADYAFSACSNLTHITIPESLTFIGIRSFIGCTGLPAFIVPENVVSIGSQAFANCTALTLGCFAESYGHSYANTNGIPHALVAKITYDANGGNGGGSFVMYSGTAMSAPSVTRPSFVFNGWSPVVPALVPEVNTTYTAQWVTLLSYTITNQVVTITGLNTALTGLLTIPDTIENFPVKHIAASALKNKTGLTGVNFPAGLLTIGEQAFRGCTGLTSITLPSTLTTIEGAAFNGCTNLTSIIIPASVTTIGIDVFTGCTGLTVYVYPRSYALDYADGNQMNYKVFVTVSFSLNGGTGTVPSAQNGVTGNAVNLPVQGDILRANYHFLGWATSASASAPLASYVMSKANVTLYAVWSRIPTISAFSGAATVINIQNSLIYGLAPGVTQATFESTYIALTGNGRLEYTLPGSGSFGTDTKVKVIDNITEAIVNTYTIVIFGDVNGDASIDSIDAGQIVDVENYAITWDPVTDAALRKAADVNGDGSIDSIDAGIIVDAENYMVTINQITGLV